MARKMGEYYNWVNVDRKEYICPNDFNYGNKKHESLVRRNEFLCALRELLSNEWKSNHVFFMGDEKLIQEDTNNETLRILYGHTVQVGYPEDACGTVMETYKNVSGLFKEEETVVRKHIQCYFKAVENNEPMLQNDYGIDISDPFKGLFSRTGLDFRYTINHTKRFYYSCECTKILYLNHTENYLADPLPVLMGYGRVSETGAWVGDIIGVSDEIPDGYELLKEIYLDW